VESETVERQQGRLLGEMIYEKKKGNLPKLLTLEQTAATSAQGSA
jgi:hypothetical protein